MILNWSEPLSYLGLSPESRYGVFPGGSKPLPAPTAPGYFQITEGDFIAALANLLDDAGMVFWSAAELRLYLAEALRTWQAYTGWYRGRASASLTPGSNWVTLSDSLTPPLLANTVTDQYLTSIMLYHLLEQQLAGGVWTGTDQFNLAQVQTALQNRLNRFIGDAGFPTIRLLQQSGVSPPVSRAILPTATIDLRRVAWVDAAGTKTKLWKVNEWELTSFLAGWPQTQGDPQVYSQALTAPNMIQLAPPPSVNGALELLVVEQGPTLNLAAGFTVLGIPDDLSWGVKFGALADLLSGDGQAKDADRAAYCEARYQEAVQIARTFPSVLQVSVDGSPVYTGSVLDLDTFTPGWQNVAPGTTQSVGMAGRRLLAVSPTPQFSANLAIDVAQNIPVPTVDWDYVQIPPDVLPVLLGYAQHLASFKMGGQEFMVTEQQRKNLLMEAANYNGRLRQLNFFNDAQRSPSLTMTAELPRIDVPVLVAPGGPING